MGQQGREKCKMRGRKIQSKIDGYGLQATIRLSLCEQETIDCITKNSVFHYLSKHIDTRCRFIIECIMKKEVQLNFTKSQGQITVIFT